MYFVKIVRAYGVWMQVPIYYKTKFYVLCKNIIIKDYYPLYLHTIKHLRNASLKFQLRDASKIRINNFV